MREYKFTKVNIDFSEPFDEFSLSLIPRGEFYRSEHLYYLSFDFSANSNEKTVVRVICEACFVLSSDEIPEFFYANSIAIVFPYVRAFISTISLQANIVPPIVLPTLNLSSLRDDLRESTTIHE